MNGIVSSLRLFNAVPESGIGNLEFLASYGVVIAPTASGFASEIKEWLRDESLTGHQLNASFHKSWEKLASAPTWQLWIEQIQHYLSTYGLESLGLYREEWIYIPVETLELPEKICVRVIHGFPADELEKRCFTLLSSAALAQETIEDCLSVLEYCCYQFTGDESISNREAQSLIADKTGILPKNPDTLFRYLYYKAAGETLVIKNQRTYDSISANRYRLPVLSEQQLIGLSHSFNRYKPLWLSIKKANQDNVAIVNRISKLSKSHHRPLPINVLGSLTSEHYTAQHIRDTASRANIFQLVRAVNALRQYQIDPYNRFYKIRNGKGWVTRNESILQLANPAAEDLLITEIKRRLDGKSVYIPECVDYAFPVSENQSSGSVPMGTKVSIPTTGKFLLTGIHWRGEFVDLDLRADSLSGSVGWNAGLRTDEKGIMHSGDMTRAPDPDGAAEWLYMKQIDEPYLVKCNLYRGEDGHPFKLIIGHGNNISSNYMIDPGSVLFSASSSMTQKEMLIGLLVPATNGVDFYLVNQGSGNLRVGRDDTRSGVMRMALISQFTSMLRLRDVLECKDDLNADVDLSPDKLTKDALLNLVNT